MADFHHLDDAREIWLDVKARFGGNEESKKMRKTILKQAFSKFSVSEEERLHKGYDRFQKILSQLNQMQAKPDNDDVNIKFLRALPSSWSQVALTLKTRGGLAYLSFDDLYNKLRSLEINVKGGSSYGSRSTIVALTHSVFIGAASTNTKMVYSDQPSYSSLISYTPVPSGRIMEDVLHSFVAENEPIQQLAYEDFKQVDQLEMEELDIKWQMVMLSLRINKFQKKVGKKINFNNKDSTRFDRRKARCYNFLQLGHFARECNMKKVDEKARYSIFKISEVKTKEPKAMSDFVVPAGNAASGVNPAAVEFAMMGNSPKDWYHTTQLALEEKVRILSAKLENTTNTLKYSETLYDQAKLEKKEWEVKFVESLARFDKWKESSKNLAKLLYSSMSTRTKLSLGFKAYIRSDEVCDLSTPSVFDPKPDNREVKSLYERFIKAGKMHEVPPPITGTFMPTSYQSDLVETQATFGSKSNTSSIPTSESNEFISCDNSDKSLASKTYNFASCVSSPKTNDSFSTVDVKLLPKYDVKDPSLTNDLPSCSFKENVKPPRNLSSVPAGSRNSSASISAGRSIPAASRNRSASIYIGRSIPTASRNRPASIHAGKHILAGKINKLAPFPAGSSVPTDLICSGVPRTMVDLIYLHGFILNGPQGRLKSMTGNKEKLDDFVQVKGGTVTFGGGDDIQPEQHINCLLAKASLEESTKWHRRMAYLNFKTINKLAKHGLVKGLPLKLFTNEQNCVACNKGKQHKASYKAISTVRTIFEPLQLFHMDLFGPTSIRSIDHKFYSLVVTDDFKAVSTACYVLNRVSITNPHNKTPYELLSGRKDIDGFLVGYAAHSKAYRVYNLSSKKVEETLNLRYLEDKPNVQGLGQEWYFNLDYLTDSLGYTRFKTNPPAGPTVHDVSAPMENNLDYAEELATLQRQEYKAHFAVAEHGFEFSIDTIALLPQAKIDIRRNLVPTAGDPAGSIVPTGGVPAGSVPASDVPTGSVPASSVPTGGALAGSSVPASGVPASIIPASSVPAGGVLAGSIISAKFSDPATSASVPATAPAATSPLLPEPNSVAQALEDPDWVAAMQEKMQQFYHQQDPDWVAAMQEEMQQFYHQQVWKLVPLPDGKIAIGTKWILKNKRDAKGIMVRNKARLVAQGHRQEEGIDYDEGCQSFVWTSSSTKGLVYLDDIIFGSINKAWCDEFEVLMKGEFKMSAMGELMLFLRLQVKQLPDGIFISQDKYVKDMLKKFDMESVRTATTPYEVPKHKSKDDPDDAVNVHLFRSMIGSLMYLTASRPDIMFPMSACSRHQVTPLTSHLNAVKKIFKYLKGQPNLGLWYPRDSPFQLEAYSDSDYAGSHGDRKSTTGGCQFLGRRLISWQCKNGYPKLQVVKVLLLVVLVRADDLVPASGYTLPAGSYSFILLDWFLLVV
nr:hypothetical protein [Tanacetum cinerariifolium]